MSALGELAALIDDFTEKSEAFTTAEIGERLLKGHRELIDQWFEENRPIIIRTFVRDRLRHTRNNHRNPHNGSEQQQETEHRSIFAESFPVNDNKVWKPLGLMYKADHLFVADEAKRGSAALKLKEELHRHIAKKLGNRSTQEVFTEEQMEALFAQYELREE